MERNIDCGLEVLGPWIDHASITSEGLMDPKSVTPHDA